MLTKTRVIATLATLINHPKYDHNNFIKKLMSAARLPSVNKKEDAVIMLLEVYNKNLPRNKRINL